MDIRNENDAPVDIANMERVEQELAHQYIRADDVVLELGARYGSVSCIANSKLSRKTNMVCVEPDDRVWGALERNRRVNKCEFHIVRGFISSKKLGLTNLDDGYGGYGSTFIEQADTKIASYTLDEIKQKHHLNFNVLIADCEGFLEVFFDENPTLYDSLRLVIFEADCPEKCNYEKIRATLREKGFVNALSGHQNVWLSSASIQRRQE